MGRPKKTVVTLCMIVDCGEPVRARGWCNVHYRRWLRTGDPSEVKIIHGDVEARFWSKVEDTGACWAWTGSLTDEGYGLLGIGGTRNQLAHRWSYEHHVGPIPEGLHLDHLCRVRNCVNPSHLEPVTSRENSRRGAAAKTTCINGHDYDEANTQWVLTRVCRTCRDAQRSKYLRATRQRRKADRATPSPPDSA